MYVHYFSQGLDITSVIKLATIKPTPLPRFNMCFLYPSAVLLKLVTTVVGDSGQMCFFKPVPVHCFL